MDFKRLFTTKMGVFFVSMILGLGLATIFFKVCDGKNCIDFNGPVINEIDGKVYKFGELCYKYKLEPSPEDKLKKTVELASTVSLPVS